MVILKQIEVVDKLQAIGALSTKSAGWMYKSIDDDSNLITMERDSIHRSFLKSTAQRKKEEDKEIRLSLRSSQYNIGMLPENLSFGGRVSFRASAQLPTNTTTNPLGRGSFVDNDTSKSLTTSASTSLQSRLSLGKIKASSSNTKLDEYIDDNDST